MSRSRGHFSSFRWRFPFSATGARCGWSDSELEPSAQPQRNDVQPPGSFLSYKVTRTGPKHDVTTAIDPLPFRPCPACPTAPPRARWRFSVPPPACPQLLKPFSATLLTRGWGPRLGKHLSTKLSAHLLFKQLALGLSPKYLWLVIDH